MAATNPSPYGPLKGEVLLANGSRIVFDSPEWELSFSLADRKCVFKAKEGISEPRIIAWDPAKDDSAISYIRSYPVETTQQSVDIRVDGKALVEQTKHTVELENLKSKIASQRVLLEDAEDLLNRYAEACPWEDGLNAAKDHIVGLIDNLKKETPPKKANERDPLWEILKELVEIDATYGEGIYERCVFCKSKGDIVSNFRHEPTCIVAKARRLVWYKQESDRGK